MWIIVGLGNPGEGYERTRHNAGRVLVEAFAEKGDFSEWKADKKLQALVANGTVGKHAVKLLLPETFMNKSGLSVKPLVKTIKAAEKLVVIYDELDMPMGSLKISFGRGSGGHKGVESIARSIKTKDFVRFRIGISPATPSGKLKKPKGDGQVLHFIMGVFSKKDETMLKDISKTAHEALTMLIERGRTRAMNEFN